ncbi:hypothetical protein ABPG72_022109 [Tetrahymena utriculariae]
MIEIDKIEDLLDYKNLETLHIDLSLADKDINLSNFGSVLSTMTNLSNLKVDQWNIGDNGANGLKTGLSRLNNLKKLNLRLYYNLIVEKGLISLSMAFTNLTKLKILDLNLSFNKFNILAISHLALGLAKLSSLQTLNLILRKIL